MIQANLCVLTEQTRLSMSFDNFKLHCFVF